MVGKLVGWLLAAAVPPSVAAGAWRHLVADHAVISGVLFGGYEGALILIAFSWKIVQKLGDRWQKRIVDNVDRALGRRVSRFDQRYRASMLGSLRFIDLKGLPTIGFYTPELDEVFVDVSLAYRAPHQVPGDLLAQLPTEVTDRHSIGDFLDRQLPVVLAVIGVPGSGKTTLLRHTARQICRDRRGRRRTVPILLCLRDHVAAVISTPKVTLPELLRDTLEHGLSEPAGWFDQKLRNGDCVVLLDGLDEVARQEDRRKIADWVESQIKQYPKNDYVITSRPQGYLSARINGATVLQVHSFTDEQVVRFVRGWYLAVEKHSTDATDAEARWRAEAAADDLLDRLSRSPGLYDLTINPLLLTMIANVHRYRGALPGSRARLYDEICQAILWRRQEAKKLPIKLDGDKKEMLLRGLAFTMMQQRVRDLPRAAVLAEIRPTLRRMSTKLTAEDFLIDVASNGLLIERETELYSFAHLTFQEYLAATHIRNMGCPQILANAVDDVWWRETTLLYAARSDTDPIVEACLDSASVTALSLAFDSAEQGSQLAPELRDRLDKLLDSAFTLHADHERRRLMAGVLVARHLRHLIRTGDSGRVCTRPITTGIYWLYQQDTNGPAPDGPTQSEPGLDRPRTDEPIVGVRGNDALAFVLWVNSITGHEPGYRLPNRTEIEDPAVHRGLNTPTPQTPPLSAWLESASGHHQPQLWTPAGTAHPHMIDTTTLVQHVNSDIERSVPTLTQLLLLRAIVAVRSLARGLDLLPSLDHALDHARDHAFDLSRTLNHVHHLNHALDLRPALNHVHDLNDALDRTRRNCDRALDLARTLTRDLVHTLNGDLARTCDLALTRHLALTHHLVLALDLDLPFDHTLDLVMGSALSYALAHVLRQDTPSVTWPAEFSRAFIEQTVIAKAGYIVSPDTLTDELRSGQNALLECLGPSREVTPPSWAYQITNGLEEIFSPIFSRQQPLTADTATALRLTSLCLAAEAGARAANHISDTFCGIAAGVTWLERRANSQAPPTETIILATT